VTPTPAAMMRMAIEEVRMMGAIIT